MPISVVHEPTTRPIADTMAITRPISPHAAASHPAAEHTHLLYDRRLHEMTRLVQRLARRAGIQPPPRVDLIPDPHATAFAFVTPALDAIHVSRRLLRERKRTILCLLAHELGHLYYRHTIVATGWRAALWVASYAAFPLGAALLLLDILTHSRLALLGAGALSFGALVVLLYVYSRSAQYARGHQFDPRERAASSYARSLVGPRVWAMVYCEFEDCLPAAGSLHAPHHRARCAPPRFVVAADVSGARSRRTHRCSSAPIAHACQHPPDARLAGTIMSAVPHDRADTGHAIDSI